MVGSVQDEVLDKEKRQREEQDDNGTLLNSKRRELEHQTLGSGSFADNAGLLLPDVKTSSEANGHKTKKNTSSEIEKPPSPQNDHKSRDKQLDTVPKAVERVSIEDNTLSTTKETKPASLKSFGGFASGSAFGKAQSTGGFASLLSGTNDSQPSAFSSLLHDSAPKSSIFDADTKAANGKSESRENDEDNTDGEADEPDGVDEDQYVVVKGLERTTVPTGEEGETCIHLVRAKLYAIDPRVTETGWKERGVGNLRVLQDSELRTRLVMRADAVLRVILNLPLHPEYKIESGGESMGEKTIRLFGVEDGVGTWLAIRVSSKKSADELKDLIERSMRALPTFSRKSQISSPDVQEAEPLQPVEIPTSVEGIVKHSTTKTTIVESNSLDSVEAKETKNAQEIEKEKQDSTN